MTSAECPREAEVLEALQGPAWPAAADPELLAHVDGCPACGELVGIVLPLLADQRTAAAAAPVPSSAIMWWRLQMRARQEAERRAMRPIAAFQGLALACGTGLLLGAVSMASPVARQFFGWLAGLCSAVVRPALTASAWAWSDLVSPAGLSVALAAMLLVVVTPAALYFAAGDR